MPSTRTLMGTLWRGVASRMGPRECCWHSMGYHGPIPFRPFTTTLPLDRDSSSSSSTIDDTRRPRRRKDPLAKRPNHKCDPYGQGGQPLPRREAEALCATVHADWTLLLPDHGEESSSSSLEPPVMLVREWIVVGDNLLAGAHLLSTVAAVAQLQNHGPSWIGLERRIVRRGEWQVVLTVQCQTTVLGGLSTHDFYLAMMIDVEMDRPQNKALWQSRDAAAAVEEGESSSSSSSSVLPDTRSASSSSSSSQGPTTVGHSPSVYDDDDDDDDEWTCLPSKPPPRQS